MKTYSITLYAARVPDPRAVIFEGHATFSGVLAIISMCSPDKPKLRLEYIETLQEKGHLHIHPTDTTPYEVQILPV